MRGRGDYAAPGSPTDLLCHLALNYLGTDFLSLGWPMRQHFHIPQPWETLVRNNDSLPLEPGSRLSILLNITYYLLLCYVSGHIYDVS